MRSDFDSTVTNASPPQLPPVLDGFSHIKRYWDRQHQAFAAKILPGEFYVSNHGEMVVTVLGSCISTCVRDTVHGVGGMNHFMLPKKHNEKDHDNAQLLADAARYGNWAMEYLINNILKNGGERRNLEAKIFGGGRVLQGMDSIDIGARNAEFAVEYMAREAIKVVAQDVGDVCPRKVLFFSDTGKVKVRKIKKLDNATLVKRERAYSNEISHDEGTGGEIDLF